MTRIFEWERLNNQELAALDRAQTVVLLPLGHTQQHGPHLPHGTTSFIARRIAEETAELLTMTDYRRQVVILPLLAYGADPVEGRRPGHFPLCGSLSLRADTLEAVVVDIAQGVVENGFRYLFAVGYHAGQEHCRAVQSAFERLRHQVPALVALDTFSYVYAGAEANAAPDLPTLTRRRISPIEQAAVDAPGHAATAATAIMLALDANLVARHYAGLEGLPEENIARLETWPGYFGGAPALAEADLGQAVLSQQAYRVTALIRRALAGESLEGLPVYPGY